MTIFKKKPYTCKQVSASIVFALLALFLLLVPSVPPASIVQATGSDEEQGPMPKMEDWDGTSWCVHEWGTFTSVQGSDGVSLCGLHHSAHDLPEFVYDLEKNANIAFTNSSKMETPVIYFYNPSSEEVPASACVRFPRGLITQWYPIASAANYRQCLYDPTTKTETLERTAINKIQNGSITWGAGSAANRWTLQVLPRSTQPTLPQVGDDDPWRFCREVDACTVRMCNRRGIEEGVERKPSDIQVEKCLFYRGLGDFSLPFSATVTDEVVSTDRYTAFITLRNSTPEEPLAHVFIVWVKDGKSGFHYLPTLKDNETLAQFSISLTPINEGTKQLADMMSEKLALTGLFAKEARAMVNTWREGYFQDEGLRVLYVLPKPFMERTMPLRISNWSVQSSTVRTFVGRTELLSPSREAEMEKAVQHYASGTVTEREDAARLFERWGRFAIPYYNRIMSMTTDAKVKKVVADKLEEFKVTRPASTLRTS